MIFEISHNTRYIYSDNVFFEPHYLRFKPRNTAFSVVKNFNIKIEPNPSGISKQIDVENNSILLGWFDGMHEEMKITSNVIVEVKEHNPFDFLVHPAQYLKLPFEYDIKAKQLIQASLNGGSISKDLKEYGNSILSHSQNKSVEFFLALTKKIHLDFKLEYRETGEPNNPDYTFNSKIGSCRDLAWMQIQLLRSFGIACRFVSGYYFVESENPEFELHAWLEAYLPGAGWIGLDPSHGILTSIYHISVASSAFHENTMPVNGSIRGEAKSKLITDLNISRSV